MGISLNKVMTGKHGRDVYEAYIYKTRRQKLFLGFYTSKEFAANAVGAGEPLEEGRLKPVSSRIGRIVASLAP